MHYTCQELVFRNMKNVASVQMTPYSVTKGGGGGGAKYAGSTIFAYIQSNLS